jgi:hypothetical protein
LGRIGAGWQAKYLANLAAATEMSEQQSQRRNGTAGLFWQREDWEKRKKPNNKAELMGEIIEREGAGYVNPDEEGPKRLHPVALLGLLCE